MKLKNKLEVEETLEVGVIPNASNSNFSVVFETAGLFQRRQVGSIINKNDNEYLPSVSNAFPSSVFVVNASTTHANPNLTVSFVNQVAGTVFAAPQSLNGTPAFRMLQDSDLNQTTVFTKIGNLPSLTTTNKNNLVDAINEVKDSVTQGGHNLLTNVPSGNFTNGGYILLCEKSNSNSIRIAGVLTLQRTISSGSSSNAILNLSLSTNNNGSNLRASFTDITTSNLNCTYNFVEIDYLGDTYYALKVSSSNNSFIFNNGQFTGYNNKSDFRIIDSSEGSNEVNFPTNAIQELKINNNSIWHTGNFSQTDINNWNDAYLLRHSHSNKGVLDNITQSVIDNSHAHSNKVVLDGITSQLISEWNTAYTQRHTHANKALLDTYNQTNVNITDAVNLRHTHTNKAILDAITASFTTAEKTKLSGIEAGAEVNVNADWNATSGDAEILNKPTIPPQLVYTGSNGINVTGTVISPTYGTTAGTIAQGNDSRINNGQTAFGWGDFRDYGLDSSVVISDLDNQTLGSIGFTASSTTNLAGLPYGSVINLGGAGGNNGFQLYGSYADTSGIRYRRLRNGVLDNWVQVIDSGNLNSQATALGFIKSSALPTVNNGALTLTTGTGLSGSANFTANQSGNSSFSVSVASTHKLPTVAEWNALPATNTTYTGSNGIDLVGTDFRLSASTLASLALANTAVQPSTLSGYLPLNSNQTGVAGGISTDVNLQTNSIVYAGSSAPNRPNNTNATIFSMKGLAGYGGQIATRGGLWWLRNQENSVHGDWETIATREWSDSKFALTGSLSGYVPTSRTITAGNGLSGGGTLAANRTITLGTPSAITLSSTNSVTTSSHTHAFTPGGTTAQYIRGDGSLATMPANTDTVTRLRGTTSGTYTSGDLTLVAGANTTITQSGATITIASTNTNTTYTAGTGLTLSGTTFGQTITTSGTGTFVKGITQTANGFAVDLSTPPDTTYTAGAGLTLSGTTFSLPITYSGSGNYVSAITQTTNGLTVTRGTLPTIPTVNDGKFTVQGTGSLTGAGSTSANASADTTADLDLTTVEKNRIQQGVWAYGAIPSLIDGVDYHHLNVGGHVTIQKRKTIVNIPDGSIGYTINVDDAPYEGYELAINGCGEWSVTVNGSIMDKCNNTDSIILGGLQGASALFWWSDDLQMWVQAI